MRGRGRRKGARPKDTLVHGNRYDKKRWEPVVRKMWAAGALYADIAKAVGTTRSTMTRYVWELGLASKHKHRHSLRHSILAEHDRKTEWANLKKIDAR